jgi:hypothetical protein
MIIRNKKKSYSFISIAVLLTAIRIVIFLKDETLQMLGKVAVVGSTAYKILKVLKIKRLDETK